MVHAVVSAGLEPDVLLMWLKSECLDLEPRSRCVVMWSDTFFRLLLWWCQTLEASASWETTRRSLSVERLLVSVLIRDSYDQREELKRGTLNRFPSLRRLLMYIKTCHIHHTPSLRRFVCLIELFHFFFDTPEVIWKLSKWCRESSLSSGISWKCYQLWSWFKGSNWVWKMLFVPSTFGLNALMHSEVAARG